MSFRPATTLIEAVPLWPCPLVEEVIAEGAMIVQYPEFNSVVVIFQVEFAFSSMVAVKKKKEKRRLATFECVSLELPRDIASASDPVDISKRDLPSSARTTLPGA